MSDPEYGLTTANFIITRNLSYPRWTHEVFAFPTLEIRPSTEKANVSSDRTGHTLTAKVPATRAIANCSLVPQRIDASVTKNHTRMEQLIQWFVPNVTKPFPPAAETHPFITVNQWGQYQSGNGYFGFWYTDEMAYDSVVFNENGIPVVGQNELPVDFPRALAAFGEVRNNITTSVSTLYCKPYIEQVTTEVQFLLPHLDFDLNFAPRPDPSTRTVFSHDSYTALGASAHLIPDNFWNLAKHQDAHLDFFPVLAVYGLGGTPITELVGPDNVENLIAAVDHTYGLYMAQILNTQRKALSSPLPLEGTLMNPSRLRLQQDKISTRILQALLAAIAAFTIAAYALLDTRRVIPKNPCSIAAFGSLVADSKWLEIIRERKEKLQNREDLTEEELEKEVMAGLVLSMGWRGQPWNRRFGIDVGQADMDEQQSDLPTVGRLATYSLSMLHGSRGRTNDGREELGVGE